MSSLAMLPLIGDVLNQHRVRVNDVREAIGQYLELIEELLLETDTFGKAYDVLALSDRRDEVAAFLALLEP